MKYQRISFNHLNELKQTTDEKKKRKKDKEKKKKKTDGWEKKKTATQVTRIQTDMPTRVRHNMPDQNAIKFEYYIQNNDAERNLMPNMTLLRHRSVPTS